MRLHYRNTLCIGNLTPCIFTCCTISISKCILDANTVYRRSQILFIQRISHIFRRIFIKLSNINRKTFRLFLISGFLFLEIGYNLDFYRFSSACQSLYERQMHFKAPKLYNSPKFHKVLWTWCYVHCRNCIESQWPRCNVSLFVSFWIIKLHIV